MAHKRKDTLTAPKEWAKHLRPFEKRKTNKAERRAAKREVWHWHWDGEVGIGKLVSS